MHDERRAFLFGLPGRLAAALGPRELITATSSDADGVSIRYDGDSIRIDGRLLTSTTPTVQMTFEMPHRVNELCQEWGIERPVGVSRTSHQTSWQVESLDLQGDQSEPTTSSGLRFGAWDVRVWLPERPPGPLPQTTSGGSPAYDLARSDMLARGLTITRRWPSLTTVGTDDPAVGRLRGEMAQRWPEWRLGWEPAPDETFVAVWSGDSPIACAAYRAATGDRLAATLLCVSPGATAPGDGAALLDALEALALDGGARSLRLDESSFLVRDVVPFERYGYRIGPPYDGDPDVPLWAERQLRHPDNHAFW